jgi:hypothetical protein
MPCTVIGIVIGILYEIIIVKLCDSRRPCASRELPTREKTGRACVPWAALREKLKEIDNFTQLSFPKNDSNAYTYMHRYRESPLTIN